MPLNKSMHNLFNFAYIQLKPSKKNLQTAVTEFHLKNSHCEAQES